MDQCDVTSLPDYLDRCWKPPKIVPSARPVDRPFSAVGRTLSLIATCAATGCSRANTLSLVLKHTAFTSGWEGPSRPFRAPRRRVGPCRRTAPPLHADCRW